MPGDAREAIPSVLGCVLSGECTRDGSRQGDQRDTRVRLLHVQPARLVARVGCRGERCYISNDDLSTNA